MSDFESNVRDTLALWAIPGIGSMNAKRLISYAGSIEQLFKMKTSELQRIAGIGEHLAEAITKENYYAKADEAIEFAQKFNIEILTKQSANYPEKLKICDDSPMILFMKGQPVTNNRKHIAIVGTRNATPRGQSFCKEIIEQMKNRYPDICIVSGLAYGIDIAAHRASLDLDVATIGVLAHGLDTIYPASHKKFAAEMLRKGALLTEFFPKTAGLKTNFVRRNRIVAGMCDATIVVESDIKGGSLITADIANSYNRDVFALPGRHNDKFSAGCNKLIKSHQAHLVESFDDIEYVLGWNNKTKPVQRQLFIELDSESQKIYDALNVSEQTIDDICRETSLKMAKVSALLLDMELKGIIRCLPGKLYSLA